MQTQNVQYLGIDWGSVRIGLALGDSETGMASPYGIVASFDDVLKVIKKEEVEKIILGKPMMLSGGDENLMAGFVKFVEKLKKKTKLPIELIDERLSSKAADALVGDKKTKAGRDAVAAMLILQSYFDKMSYERNN